MVALDERPMECALKLKQAGLVELSWVGLHAEGVSEQSPGSPSATWLNGIETEFWTEKSNTLPMTVDAIDVTPVDEAEYEFAELAFV